MSEQHPRSRVPRRPVRLGVVGLGTIGTDTLRAATGHPDVVVPVAADLDARALDRHRPAHPDVVFTTDPHRVLESPDVDAVYIATPPACHRELALAALRRGLGVFCEKPLAVTLADGAEMLAAAEASGLACAVNFALSDRHAALEVRRALAAGELGRVTGVEVRLRFPAWPRAMQANAAWVATRRQGGFLREVFSHFAYLTDRLLGPLEVESATVTYPATDPDGAETAAAALLRAGDVPVRVSGACGVPGAEWYEWIVSGTRRSYRLFDWDRLFLSDDDRDGWRPVELAAAHGSEATRLSLFARAVRGETVPDLADFAAGYRVQRVVEALHQCAAADREGAPR